MTISSIDALRAKAGAVQEKTGFLIEKLFTLETELKDAFSGMKIYSSSADIVLEQIGEDDWVYGHLFFDKDGIAVSYRDTSDDHYDNMHYVQKNDRTYNIRHISTCSTEWLKKLVLGSTVESLIANLSQQLDVMNDSADKSVIAINKISEMQAEELGADVLAALTNVEDEHLVKKWSNARALISIAPAESITQSSSFLESVCRKILLDIAAPLPVKKDITALIAECVKKMKLSDSKEAETDITQLFGGLKSVLQSVGVLRTHFGSAHGSSPGDYEINEHYARLANNAAATASTFLLHRHRINMKK